MKNHGNKNSQPFTKNSFNVTRLNLKARHKLDYFFHSNQFHFHFILYNKPSSIWVNATPDSPVLAFLAIYRQIRDFGLLFGDRKFELAIYRQSPKFRDFEPQRLAILANSRKSLQFRRNTDKIEQNPTKKDHFSGHILLNFNKIKL